MADTEQPPTPPPSDDNSTPAPPASGGGSLFAANEKIVKINVAEEIKNSFLDYSMSVIISRALPDVRDGLKPSQRRILFAMHELGVLPNRKHLKCAKIVGETMGNYHPHGDQAIYPTLVHMAQPWAMRERLVDGQGNFGSVEGDPPASMRYTEARLAPLGAVLMEDMDRDTVDFVPNYDETRMEPTVFPAAFPNLLVNGGTGIAVGMATNIPPHNLGEVIDGICAQIDNPAITIPELMRHIRGPDFPTGCMVCGLEGIREYFHTGRGSVKVRGKIGIEELKGNREQLVITEIPFNVNRAALVSRIAELVNEKTPGLTDITNIRDESDENTRVVIELKRDAVAKVVINNLYQLTQLESSFAVNMLAIDRGRPKTLNLKEIIACYIEHRREVVLRRTRFDLRKAEERAEILEGYLVALANLDEVIRIIRSSSNREEARIRLLAFEFTRAQVEAYGIRIRNEARLTSGRYLLSELQVNAILDLRLYQLTGMEIDKVEAEYRKLIAHIEDLLDILAREERVMAIIKAELQAIKAKYATPRLTELVPDEGEIAIEDLVANEGVIITITHKGLIKRTNISSYRAQRRGGKGVIGMATREVLVVEGEDRDFIEHLFTASTHDFLMFFTNTGRVYVERVLEIPDMGRAAKGRSIANLLELRPEEKIAALIRIQSRTGPNREDLTWESPEFVFFATQKGIVKKTALSEFAHVHRGGIIALQIEENDTLIDAKLTNGNNEVVLITADGMSIRFHEEDVRPMGRQAVGVWGIRLEPQDSVVALAVVIPDATLLVAGENGVGKRTEFEEYRRQSRGGKGIITMKTTERTGRVVGALTVRDEDQIMLITAKGQMVRTFVREIRQTGRNASGVKLIELEEGDILQAIAPVISEKDEEAAENSQPASTGENPPA
ncbi:DNA gyrase subunit A [Fontisphaera persica]|uniref:DNA gyrase subunit A n=1 Tax=Fontisphaera persica TaxID=2974023 RepID=UPI0024BFB608|nr:DNA gyrase subunit A [Fontisphaera persica]WCJ59891.1 DNA gyrase subunit A [Fontisphaera persica]